MSTVLKKIQNHTLVVFFFLAFALGGPFLLLSTPDRSTGWQVLVFLLASYAPAVAAWIALAIARDPGETRAFRRRLGLWRMQARWYLAALLLPSVAWLCSLGVIALVHTGLTLQTSSFFFFPLIFILNFGEEAGWRGYALPRLLKRFHPLAASLILGLIWGAYHLQLYWQRPGFAALFFTLILAISVIMTWLFIQTGGSVVATSLFHTVINTWSQALLAEQGTDDLFATLITLLWVAVVALIWVYGPRLARTPAMQA